ncbi:MAG TPA: hypothetical protein VJS92_06590 [Candidatus Polarisedimenticolaceae bacterium]|nr:hypothetical protein [Candidatus Polarisedimenticolaceae bacterium]
MNDRSPSMLKSTLIGGSVFGVLSAVPILGLLNCACCALVLGAGFFAAYLYSNQCKGAGAAFRPADGAIVGLVAALFHALAWTVVHLLFRAIVGAEDPADAMSQMDQFNIPEESREMARKVAELMVSGVGQVLLFFVWLLLGAIFSTLGGLIGGAVFKVEPPAPPAAPVVPPTYPADELPR